MIKPSIDELTKGKINRYELVIATAKCARELTDEYVERRAESERKIASKETDKTIAAMLKLEASEEKAVKAAINRIADGEYVVDEPKHA